MTEVQSLYLLKLVPRILIQTCYRNIVKIIVGWVTIPHCYYSPLLQWLFCSLLVILMWLEGGEYRIYLHCHFDCKSYYNIHLASCPQKAPNRYQKRKVILYAQCNWKKNWRGMHRVTSRRKTHLVCLGFRFCHMFISLWRLLGHIKLVLNKSVCFCLPI